MIEDDKINSMQESREVLRERLIEGGFHTLAKLYDNYAAHPNDDALDKLRGTYNSLIRLVNKIPAEEKQEAVQNTNISLSDQRRRGYVLNLAEAATKMTVAEFVQAQQQSEAEPPDPEEAERETTPQDAIRKIHTSVSQVISILRFFQRDSSVTTLIGDETRFDSLNEQINDLEARLLLLEGISEEAQQVCLQRIQSAWEILEQLQRAKIYESQAWRLDDFFNKYYSVGSITLEGQGLDDDQLQDAIDTITQAIAILEDHHLDPTQVPVAVIATINRILRTAEAARVALRAELDRRNQAQEEPEEEEEVDTGNDAERERVRNTITTLNHLVNRYYDRDSNNLTAAGQTLTEDEVRTILRQIRKGRALIQAARNQGLLNLEQETQVNVFEPNLTRFEDLLNALLPGNAEEEAPEAEVNEQYRKAIEPLEEVIEEAEAIEKDSFLNLPTIAERRASKHDLSQLVERLENAYNQVNRDGLLIRTKVTAEYGDSAVGLLDRIQQRYNRQIQRIKTLIDVLQGLTPEDRRLKAIKEALDPIWQKIITHRANNTSAENKRREIYTQMEDQAKELGLNEEEMWILKKAFDGLGAMVKYAPYDSSISLMIAPEHEISLASEFFSADEFRRLYGLEAYGLNFTELFEALEEYMQSPQPYEVVTDGGTKIKYQLYDKNGNPNAADQAKGALTLAQRLKQDSRFPKLQYVPDYILDLVADYAIQIGGLRKKYASLRYLFYGYSPIGKEGGLITDLESRGLVKILYEIGGHGIIRSEPLAIWIAVNMPNKESFEAEGLSYEVLLERKDLPPTLREYVPRGWNVAIPKIEHNPNLPSLEEMQAHRDNYSAAEIRSRIQANQRKDNWIRKLKQAIYLQIVARVSLNNLGAFRAVRVPSSTLWMPQRWDAMKGEFMGVALPSKTTGEIKDMENSWEEFLKMINAPNFDEVKTLEAVGAAIATVIGEFTKCKGLAGWLRSLPREYPYRAYEPLEQEKRRKDIFKEPLLQGHVVEKKANVFSATVQALFEVFFLRLWRHYLEQIEKEGLQIEDPGLGFWSNVKRKFLSKYDKRKLFALTISEVIQRQDTGHPEVREYLLAIVHDVISTRVHSGLGLFKAGVGKLPKSTELPNSIRRYLFRRPEVKKCIDEFLRPKNIKLAEQADKK